MARSLPLLDILALPRPLVRVRARRALRRRLRTLAAEPDQDPKLRRRARSDEIALHEAWSTETPRLCWANLPLDFWRLVLGPRLHVGAALWPRWARQTGEAEAEWCQLVAARLAIEPGQRVLEIGANPGTLARWAETEIPDLDVTLLACSLESRTLLASAVTTCGPKSASLPAATLPDFAPSRRFDRIVVVEGLTRSANPEPLLDRMLSWLTPAGRLLLQIGCHWRFSYSFQPGDEHRWMLPEVPDGALYPGQQYLNDLTSTRHLLSKWELSGEHYQRTARAWSRNLEANSEELLTILTARGVAHPQRTLRAWRDALLALEVTYGFREGQEWCVTQLLLGRRPG